MEVRVGGKLINVDNQHRPEPNVLIPICKQLTNSLYLATFLCKDKKVESEDGGTPIEYTKSPLVADVLSDLYFSACRASYTVLDFPKLGPESLIHAIPIVRGIIETCVNASYILAKGDVAAKQAIEHAHARAYMEFEKTTGKDGHSISVSDTPPVPLTENLEKILNKFTSRKRTPLNWTELSVSQRIAEVESTFGESVSIGLNGAYAVLYQEASEMIHGSYLGVLKSLGREPFKAPAINLEAIQQRNERQYVYALGSLFQAIFFTIKAFSSYTEVSNKEFLLDELHDRYFEAMFGESKKTYLSGLEK